MIPWDSWEKSRIIEDDDYWKFVSPSIYDSFRPGSVISQILEEIYEHFPPFSLEQANLVLGFK